MSELAARSSIDPLIELVMIFEKSGLLANQRHVYLVQGAIRPPPHGPVRMSAGLTKRRVGMRRGSLSRWKQVA